MNELLKFYVTVPVGYHRIDAKSGILILVLRVDFDLRRRGVSLDSLSTAVMAGQQSRKQQRKQLEIRVYCRKTHASACATLASACNTRASACMMRRIAIAVTVSGAGTVDMLKRFLIHQFSYVGGRREKSQSQRVCMTSQDLHKIAIAQRIGKMPHKCSNDWGLSTLRAASVCSDGLCCGCGERKQQLGTRCESD